MREQERVDTAIAEFPKVFGLRAFPGRKFHINRSQSFVSGGEVQLYVFTDKGQAFTRDTPGAISKEIVPAP